MTTSRALTIATLFALLCGDFTQAVQAQSVRAPSGALRSASRLIAVSRRWFDDPLNAGIGDRILATGAPSTYQIITVALPPQLPRSGEGYMEIVPRTGFAVLGPHKWLLPALEGKTKVIGIIGISASARAGLITAAEVQFHVAGTPTVIVAVEIDITLVRELAVRMQASPLRSRPGGRATFSYQLVNAGNSTESVETAIVTPKGWKVTQRSGASASVEPDFSIARQAVVSIPRDIGTGSFFMRLDVFDRGVLRSSIPLAIEILDGPSRQASAGPEITIAVARASDAAGRGGTVTTTSIRGPLFDSVRIDARFSAGENGSGPRAQALSRVGSYRITPSLAFSSPSGRLAIGAAGNSFSDLTGMYAYGRGVGLDAHRPGWHLIGLAARSTQSTHSDESAPLLGLRGDVDVGPVRFMSSLSHLRGGEISGRQLDAASLGASLDAGFSTTIQGEVARRRFAGGSGTGWSTQISRTDSRNSASVRVTSAPGGSDAFARAASEVVASISQRLSRRLGLSGSGWRLSDATAAFLRLRSSGWAIRPEFRAHSSTTIALDVRETKFAAVTGRGPRGAPLGYGGAERQAGVSVNTNVSRFYLSGSVAGGSVIRAAVTRSGFTEQRSPKIWWNSMASWRGSKTVVEAQGRMEEMRDASGAVRRQSQLSLRGDHALTAAPGRGASADWEVQQLRGFSMRPTTIVRAGVSVPVTAGLAVKLYAERNPLFTAAAGGSPWVYALRVEQSVRAPMVRPPGSTGYVYRDLNGNQRRDTGEPGVDGAVLNRGGEMTITDANGKYRLAGDTRSSIVLDEASLPLGWVRQTTGSRDIAVGTSLVAEIRFIVAPRSSIEAVEVDLSGIRAIARDASGREWVARMTGPAVASFESLPPGTYTLELDVSAVTEPLVPRLPLPSLIVTPFEPSFVTIVLDPRPLRIWRADAVPAGTVR